MADKPVKKPGEKVTQSPEDIFMNGHNIKVPEDPPSESFGANVGKAVKSFAESASGTLAAPGKAIADIGDPYANIRSAAEAGATAGTNYAQNQDLLRAALAASPVGRFSEDVYNKGWAELAGDLLGTASASALLPGPRNVAKDAMIGGYRGATHPTQLSVTVPHFGRIGFDAHVPASLAGLFTGGTGGAYLGHLWGLPAAEGGIAGSAIGALTPMVKGAIRGVREGMEDRATVPIPSYPSKPYVPYTKVTRLTPKDAPQSVGRQVPQTKALIVRKKKD